MADLETGLDVELQEGDEFAHLEQQQQQQQRQQQQQKAVPARPAGQLHDSRARHDQAGASSSSASSSPGANGGPGLPVSSSAAVQAAPVLAPIKTSAPVAAEQPMFSLGGWRLLHGPALGMALHLAWPCTCPRNNAHSFRPRSGSLGSIHDTPGDRMPGVAAGVAPVQGASVHARTCAWPAAAPPGVLGC
jgi:hypothetical protein